MMRSEDIAPLLAPTPPPAGTIRGGTGTVVSWNPLDATNVIRYNGTDLVNLPIVASSTEVLAIQPGDEVVLHIFGTGGFAIIYIMGRIVRPGTPQAASFMEIFGLKSATIVTMEQTSVNDFVDLATVGPVVSDVLIGSTGRCLVFISASIVFGSNTEITNGGLMGFQITGATTVAPNANVVLGMNTGVSGGGADIVDFSRSDQCTYLASVTGLNPGLHTFQAKYRAESATQFCNFGHRTLTVLPF